MTRTLLISLGCSGPIGCEALQGFVQDPAFTEAAQAGGAAIVNNAPANPVDLTGWGYAIGAGIIAATGAYVAGKRRRRTR